MTILKSNKRSFCDVISGLNRKNVEDFQFDENLVMCKIQGYSTKYGIPLEDTLDWIIQNNFSILFAKDALKQNKTEKLSVNIIKPLLEEVFDHVSFEVLGKSSKVVVEGIVLDYDKSILTRCKTVDFVGQIRSGDSEYNLIATHKYTKSCGGSQDNQFKDVELFLDACSPAFNRKHDIFLSILDGPYYTDYAYKSYNNRLEYLRDKYKQTNILIGSSFQIPDLLFDYATVY